MGADGHLADPAVQLPDGGITRWYCGESTCDDFGHAFIGEAESPSAVYRQRQQE